MSAYGVGDTVELACAVTDPVTGVPVDAAGIVLTITKPDGTTITPAVTHVGTGSYLVSYVVAVVGAFTFRWTAVNVALNPESGQFNVATWVPPSYVSMAEMHLQLNIPSSDLTSDTLILKAMLSASRSIERFCGNRKFYLLPTASTRTYKPGGNYSVLTHDIGSTTGILVAVGSVGAGSFTPVATTGYELAPLNALAIGDPYTELVDVNKTGIWWSGGIAPRVQVTAQWGWPDIPDPISEAAMIQAARLFRRKGSPEGVSGFQDLGVMRIARLDPDVQLIVQKYKNYGMA